MMLTEKKQHTINYMQLFLLNTWGLGIVLLSFVSLYLGYWLDGKFNSGPTFMLGLFFLAILLSIGRFYWEVWKNRRNY